MKRKGEHLDIQTFFGLVLLYANTAEQQEVGALMDLIIDQILSPAPGSVKLDS
ncbi:hypothetical protein [uncultured Alteromonas sp.]|uniref:hypothetical protein n=1 Tax=uncultured Alteromonas sp. TaxID=179113 RepID=UPI0025EA1F6E|nr:hypothetical protein [uncultured Alteromonas sp.]